MATLNYRLEITIEKGNNTVVTKKYDASLSPKMPVLGESKSEMFYFLMEWEKMEKAYKKAAKTNAEIHAVFSYWGACGENDWFCYRKLDEDDRQRTLKDLFRQLEEESEERKIH